MIIGDIIEWKGKSGTIRGRVTEAPNGALTVTLDSGKTFFLDDLLASDSLKVCCTSE